MSAEDGADPRELSARGLEEQKQEQEQEESAE